MSDHLDTEWDITDILSISWHEFYTMNMIHILYHHISMLQINNVNEIRSFVIKLNLFFH